MNVPVPLPDELANGYTERLLRLNGCSAATCKSRAFYESPFSKVLPQLSWIDKLARLVGQSPETFRHQHTMLPFNGAVQAKGRIGWLVPTPQRSQFRYSAGKLNPLGMLACPQCAKEDTAFWGVSYWRRTHQLTGVVWCSKHEAPLMLCDPSAASSLPSEALSRAKPLDRNLVTQAMANVTVRKYAEICASFLANSRSLSTNQVVHCLQARAATLGIRAHSGVRSSHISRVALQATEGPWQQMFFPDLARAREGAFVDSIDRTYSSRNVAYKAPAYAMAFAVFYDSAEDAFADLDASSALLGPGRPTHEKPLRRRSPCTPHKLSASRALGASERVQPRIRMAIEAFVDGASIADAASEQRVGEDELREAMRKALRPTFAPQQWS